MSVSDPLLKILKVFVLELRTEDAIITDEHKQLRPLCENLEAIFRKGLRKNGGWFGTSDYWSWISKLDNEWNGTRISPALCMIVNYVKNSRKAKSIKGKGRLFLRICLLKKVLGEVVQLLCNNRLLSETWYEPSESILGNEILTEIFLSLLHELKELSFSLDLKNASFLDDSWILPEYKQYEFVPCKEFGVEISTVNSYHVVLNVARGSVAGEDGKICAGDVLDEMCGDTLRGLSRSSVLSLFHKNMKKPMDLAVAKLYNVDGVKFRPIACLLRLIDRDPNKLKPDVRWHGEEDEEEGEGDGFDRKPAHAILPEEEDEERPVHGPGGQALYQAWYIGKISLGNDGRVDRIEDGVQNAVKNLHAKEQEKRPVGIELKEKEVIVKDAKTDELLFQHAYTGISSCGRRVDMIKYFAYIAGETTCSLAKDFHCYVFEGRSEEEGKIMLCAIAQGFERTHLLL
ncbi:hypothetical protein ScPMuIL_005056 [Solemya velum]